MAIQIRLVCKLLRMIALKGIFRGTPSMFLLCVNRQTGFWVVDHPRVLLNVTGII